MSTKEKETNTTLVNKGSPLKRSNKMMLLQLRREIRCHYDVFKNGSINKKEYLSTIKPLDRHINNIEMSVL